MKIETHKISMVYELREIKIWWISIRCEWSGNEDCFRRKSGFKIPKYHQTMLCNESLIHETLTLYGRDRKIRTFDPQHPMLVRYQAALCPELF